jgi:hypothetical protein
MTPQAQEKQRQRVAAWRIKNKARIAAWARERNAKIREELRELRRLAGRR